MSKQSIIKHVKLIGQGANWDEVLASYSNDPTTKPVMKSKIQELVDRGADSKSIMTELAKSAPSTGPVEGLEPPAQPGPVEEYMRASMEAAPATIKATARYAAPLAAGALAAPGGPLAMVAAPMAANQLMDMGGRVMEGEPVYQPQDLINRGIDLVAGATGIGTSNIVNPIRRFVADYAANQGAETVQRLAAGAPQFDPAVGPDWIDQALPIFNRLGGGALLGASLSARNGPVTQAVDPNVKPTNIEQTLLNIAQARGVQLTPEVQAQIRQHANLLEAVSTANPMEGMNRNITGNPLIYPEVAEIVNNITVPINEGATSMIGKSIGAKTPEEAQAFVAAKPDVVNADVAGLGPNSRQSAVNLMKEQTGPSGDLSNAIEPSYANLGGAVKSIQGKIKELEGVKTAGKESVKQAELAQMDQNQQFRMNELSRRLNVANGQVSRYQTELGNLTRQAAKLQAEIDNLPAELAQAKVQELATLQADQAETNRLYQDAEMVRQNLTDDLRNEYQNKLAEVNQQYDLDTQTTKDWEAAQQAQLAQEQGAYGRKAQEIIQGNPETVGAAASLTYGKGLENIRRLEAETGPVVLNPTRFLPREVAAAIMPGLADNLKAKLLRYAESGDDSPVSILPSELVTISQRINAKEARTAGTAGYDLTKLSQLVDGLVGKNDPRIADEFAGMRQDYAVAKDYQGDMEQAAGPVMNQGRFGAAKSGVGVSQAAMDPNSPISQLGQTEMYKPIIEEGRALGQREQDISEQTAFNLKTNKKDQAAQLRLLQERQRLGQRGIDQFTAESKQAIADQQAQELKSRQIDKQNLKAVDLKKSQVAGLLSRIPGAEASLNQAQTGLNNLEQNIIESTMKYGTGRSLKEVQDQAAKTAADVDAKIQEMKHVIDTIENVPTANRPTKVQGIERALAEINRMVDDKILTPEDATSARKAMVEFLVAPGRKQAGLEGLKEEFNYIDPKEAKARITETRIPALLKSDAQVAAILDGFFKNSGDVPAALPKAKALMDLSISSNNPEAVVGWLKNNRSLLDSPESQISWDKLKAVYGNAYKPGRPGLNETIGKIVNKALGRLDDQTRMVDWGHASQLWDSLPTNMLKDIYGPNYAAMDLTMSQLAPVFVAANAKLKAAPSSHISNLRSIASLAQFSKVILGGMVGAVGGATSGIAGGAGAAGGALGGVVGGLSLPIFMVAIAKAPNILFNRLINKGTTTQYTKSMGASIGQKEREYERTNNK